MRISDWSSDVCSSDLNHRYVFTLIQKFQSAEPLTDRSDVIVLTDEAHRSQYDTLALNMRAALPKAMFLAFTGTPLIAGEERTREVFGRSEEHTSELQSLMRISYAVFCLKKKTRNRKQ